MDLLSQPLQTRLRLLFGQDSRDVTTDLMPDLLEFSYTDKDGGEADEITLLLKDETGKWASNWRPDGGETIKAYLSKGTTLLKGSEIFCGTFFADRVSVQGSPRTMSLSAVSTPLKTPLRRTKKTRAWEKQKLSKIAETLAAESGLEFMFDSEEDPEYDRQDQNTETDLAFLKRLCDKASLSIKVTDVQLVIFNKKEYESKDPVESFVLGVSDILSWSFEQAQSETYKAVKVKYRDPKQKVLGSAGGYELKEGKSESKTSNPAVMEYVCEDPNGTDEGQVFEIKTRAKSIDEAKRLAKAKLRELNSKSVTGTLSIIGNPYLLAGEVVSVSGFGSFDGSFYIDEARHTVNSSGYTTTLSIHKTIKDY